MINVWTRLAVTLKSEAIYLKLSSVVHALRILNDHLVGHGVEGLVPGQGEDLPEGHGKRPRAALASVAVLKSLGWNCKLSRNAGAKTKIHYQQDAFPREPAYCSRGSAPDLAVVLLVQRVAHREVTDFHRVATSNKAIPKNGNFIMKFRNFVKAANKLVLLFGPKLRKIIAKILRILLSKDKMLKLTLLLNPYVQHFSALGTSFQRQSE